MLQEKGLWGTTSVNYLALSFLFSRPFYLQMLTACSKHVLPVFFNKFVAIIWLWGEQSQDFAIVPFKNTHVVMRVWCYL